MQSWRRERRARECLGVSFLERLRQGSSDWRRKELGAEPSCPCLGITASAWRRRKSSRNGPRGWTASEEGESEEECVCKCRRRRHQGASGQTDGKPPSPDTRTPRPCESASTCVPEGKGQTWGRARGRAHEARKGRARPCRGRWGWRLGASRVPRPGGAGLRAGVQATPGPCGAPTHAAEARAAGPQRGARRQGFSHVCWTRVMITAVASRTDHDVVSQHLREVGLR